MKMEAHQLENDKEMDLLNKTDQQNNCWSSVLAYTDGK